MSTKTAFTACLLVPKQSINMKIIFTLFIVLTASLSFAQKAKSKAVNCKYHHIRYPENVELSAKMWALSIVEQSSCQGAIPYRVSQTPLVATHPRSQFYMYQMANKKKHFFQATDRISNLDAKKTPYIHFELETRDMRIVSQVTKNKKPGADPQYNLIFEMETPIILKATRKGDMNVVLLDTNNFSSSNYGFTFPQNAQLGTAPDIKPNGYPSEAELLAAWRKYGKKAQLQWRDKMIAEFLRPTFFKFTNTYITFEEWDVVKIYSDRNKKGGYDHIVDAAETFNNTFAEIDADYKAGKRDKFYTDEYQTRLMGCLETWKTFLSNYDFDVSSNDGEVKAEYKQKMLLNYIHALIFTKQYDEAEKQIAHYLTKEIKAGTNADLKRLRRLKNQFQTEYEANAARMGWN